MLVALCWLVAAGSFALPRVELRRKLRCEVKNYSSVKSSLLVGRSTMPCQQTLLLLAGGLNLGSCPYRILREILRKLAWDLGSCFLLGAYQQEFQLTLAATMQMEYPIIPLSSESSKLFWTTVAAGAFRSECQMLKLYMHKSTHSLAHNN